ARHDENRRCRHGGWQPRAQRHQTSERQDGDDRRWQDTRCRVQRPAIVAMTRAPALAAFILALLVSATMLSMSAIAQRRRGGPPPPSKQTPHWPDGRVNLGPPQGEKGLWTPGGIVQLSLHTNNDTHDFTTIPLQG